MQLETDLPGLSEEALLQFDFLQLVSDQKLVDNLPGVLELLHGEDTIIALEAERVMKELLPHLSEDVREHIQEHLAMFSERVVEALGSSTLVKIKDLYT